MRFPLSTPPAIPAGTLASGPQPTLAVGDDLVLRPWQASDAPAFLAAYQDPEIRRWHTRRPDSEDQVREWFAYYRQAWHQETAASWAMTHGGGEPLGRMVLGAVDLGDGVAVCAYWVAPAARGAGVASRSLRAVSDWALGAGFHRLELDHSTRNQASCRVAVKAGFRAEGTRRNAAVHPDGRHDMHLHARVRGDQ
ncbi:GNAT family N-acetyltransferase [Micromonospora sp. AKA38]|uniref:GNAT family N-acetyltransferase n=1 Tax=Micromonospora sp. AKA38 TaxID=2733861 RepID=UPI0024928172|nr:GNAT family N-acetyltransferase [Micromonospora sp. AKA38]